MNRLLMAPPGNGEDRKPTEDEMMDYTKYLFPDYDESDELDQMVKRIVSRLFIVAIGV